MPVGEEKVARIRLRAKGDATARFRRCPIQGGRIGGGEGQTQGRGAIFGGVAYCSVKSKEYAHGPLRRRYRSWLAPYGKVALMAKQEPR